MPSIVTILSSRLIASSGVPVYLTDAAKISPAYSILSIGKPPTEIDFQFSLKNTIESPIELLG